MAYVLLPNIGNTLGGTRDQIRTNFTLLKTTIDQNHIDMDGSFPGKHIMSQYNTASFPGVGGLVAGDATVYGKSVSGVSQVFFSPDNSAQEYQLTLAKSSEFTKFATNAPPYQASPAMSGGWTFLPGGLILQYGLAEISNGGGNNTIPFPFTFPTSVFSVVNTGITTSSSINTTLIVSVAVNQFIVKNTASSSVVSMYWMAIGN